MKKKPTPRRALEYNRGDAEDHHSDNSALVLHGEASTPQGSRLRKRDQSDADTADEASPPRKQPRAAPRTMSKVAMAKAHATWVEKFEEGKCSAEVCISKLKALMSKYHPL